MVDCLSLSPKIGFDPTNFTWFIKLNIYPEQKTAFKFEKFINVDIK